jgi:hypothetical protein
VLGNFFIGYSGITKNKDLRIFCSLPGLTEFRGLYYGQLLSRNSGLCFFADIAFAKRRFAEFFFLQKYIVLKIRESKNVRERISGDQIA